MRFSHAGECCSLVIACFTQPVKGPRMSSYDGQKLAWFGGCESEECSATGNVKPRNLRGVLVNVATFFLADICTYLLSTYPCHFT